jgi:hypothetical protein
LSVDSGVSAEEGNGFFVRARGPGGHFVVELADGEVDVFGEVGYVYVHWALIIDY